MREEKRRLIHLFLQILFTTSYPFALFVSFLLVLGQFGLQFDTPFKLGNFRLETSQLTIQLAFRVDKLAGIDARHKVAIRCGTRQRRWKNSWNLDTGFQPSMKQCIRLSSGYFFCNEFTNGPLTQNLKGVNELPKMQQKKRMVMLKGSRKSRQRQRNNKKDHWLTIG